MINTASCRFLLENDNIEKILQFFIMNNFSDVMITKPQAIYQIDYIVFVVSDNSERNGLEILQVLQTLRQQMRYHKLDIFIRESLGHVPVNNKNTFFNEIFKHEILSYAIPFTKDNISTIYKKIISPTTVIHNSQAKSIFKK